MGTLNDYRDEVTGRLDVSALTLDCDLKELFALYEEAKELPFSNNTLNLITKQIRDIAGSFKNGQSFIEEEGELF